MMTRKLSMLTLVLVVSVTAGFAQTQRAGEKAQVVTNDPASPDTPRPAPGQPLLPPPVVTDTYTAKFVCGVAGDTNITHQPDAEAGRYATVVNLHNETGNTITFRKKAILLALSEQDTPPGPIKLVETLQENHALKVTCEDIYYLIGFFHHVGQIPPFMEGVSCSRCSLHSASLRARLIPSMWKLCIRTGAIFRRRLVETV